jgi:hypothetical protein
VLKGLCHAPEIVFRNAQARASHRRLAASSSDQDAQVSQELATTFELFLVGLLQQIIPKMKLFITAVRVPEIAIGNAWSEASHRLAMHRHGISILRAFVQRLRTRD